MQPYTTDKTYTNAFDEPETTLLGQAALSLAAPHDGESGFLLLDRGRDAFSWRVILADSAEKSIDAMYFMWEDDDAGKILSQRMLAAADRGVRVRIIVDDSFTESDPLYLALLGGHPGIEVRLYKPFGPKHESKVMRWLDYGADMRVLNRRMHNKLYVVDNSLAIAGGRNLGNEYFEYPGAFVNRSRDLLALGPVVTNSSSAFDLYWNSDWTVPIEQVISKVPTAQQVRENQTGLEALAGVSGNYPPRFYDDPKQIDAELARLGDALLWGKARILIDTVPERNGKAQTHAELDKTGVVLASVARAATDEVLIQSAYLVLLDSGFDVFDAMIKNGVKLKLATNSLASNNHMTAFVGYARQRKQMLETGAELYEMRPDSKTERAQFSAEQLQQLKTVFGLHAKTMVFDRKITFVGSFNVDPRSVNLNTEMGFLVESEDLANAVADSIENDIAPGNSWQVRLTDAGKLEWVTVENGVVTVESEREPMTTTSRRAEAKVMKLVPDKSQL